ncbi:uncharacterized protein LOC113303444 isoform X2 [Papaver somniferum]|uniref:uncharacterized protein LOC113303444 isoform X2 n=1 Tax=Papaver somniferum TaxID=3469 RepID=UPI000E700A94|nr:uncharacterized protein LOC113303444 isoform X2 [Papaver somniferum]
MDLGDLNKVWEIKALKRKPREDEARKILEKIAKQVQPIMKKHKWRVKLLTEFCPGNPALLGVNVGGGVQVKLRLRRPNRDLDFYPYDQECEELMTRGITGTGEGFDLPGKRLGGFSRQPPLSSIRQVALTAAEKRARVGSLLPHGPKRLGGDSDIMVALSPVQAAAMAAERRLQDDMWCGCESFGGSGEEKSSSDLPQTVESRAAPSANNSKRAGGSETRSANTRLCKKSRLLHNDTSVPSKVGEESSLMGIAAQASTSVFVQNHKAADSFEDKVIWECGSCTLFNPPLAPICKACGSAKPKDDGTKFKMWSCKFCTLENNMLLDKCEACGQWRYSYGQPVSTQTPNSGT